MPDMLEISVTGMPELRRDLGIIAGALKDDWDLLWSGFIRATKAPGNVGWIVEPRYTLEGSVGDAFRNNGRNVYAAGAWEGYANEPEYAHYKDKRGGGAQILVWKDAGSPLMRTLLNKGDGDHIEHVDKSGFVWGTKRGYAARLNQGGFNQPWDDVTPPARPIIQLSPLAGFMLGKGVQRIIVGRLKEQGINPGAALRSMRVYP